MKGRAVLVAALAALALTGCQSEHPAVGWAWSVGTCMLIKDSELGNVPCSEPHTHVVLARVAWAVACPGGTDREFQVPDDVKFCFGADTQLRSDAP